MIYLILGIIAIALLDAYQDWFLIEVRNKFLDHGRQSLQSAFVYVVWLGECAMHIVPWQMAVCTAIVIPALRWIYHDLLLNAFRGREWDYLGKNARADQLLATIERTYGLPGWLVKLLCIAISVLFSAIIYSLIIP